MRAVLAPVAIAVALLALAACGSPQPVPWQPADEKASRIVFDAPGLAGTVRETLWRQSPGYYADEELAYWYRDKSAPPVAQITRRSLAPNRYFVTLPELKDLVREFGDNTQRPVAFGPAGRSVNGLGSVEHLTFQIGGNDCIAFREVAGRAVAQPNIYVPTGNTLLLGYYCAEPRVQLTPAERAGILQALDLKPEV
jgi:predicted small lipoprotein YifL